MSKLDQVKNMSTEEQAHDYFPQGISFLDAELLKASLDNVKGQLQDWSDKNTELIKAYRELQTAIRNAAIVVRDSVNSAKEFPVEAGRLLETSAKKCADSAQKAQTVYDSALHIMDKSEQLPLWKIILLACLSSMATAALFIAMR